MSYRMFDYLVPNVNFFGPNAISVVGERCKLLGGKKALLVTDKGKVRISRSFLPKLTR